MTCFDLNLGTAMELLACNESAGGSVQNQCNATSMVGNWTLQPNDLAAGDAGTFQQWCVTVTWQ